MTDPLRYYIMEGLLGMFYAPDDNSIGGFVARLTNSYHMADKFAVTEAENGCCLTVLAPNGARVRYAINPDLYLEYGVLCENVCDMTLKVDAWMSDQRATADEFKAICAALEYA